MAQATFPENGVADPRLGYYAFTHATLVKDAATTLSDATLVIKDGRIVAVGTALPVPAGAVAIDCKGKYIYPSFIDLYADYGIASPSRTPGGGGFDFLRPSQLESTQKGPYGWNQALRSDVQAHTQFTADDSKAKSLRELGFGAVLTHVRDGIARGTAAAYGLGKEEALAAITLNAARIMGVSDKTGSIEVGKDANIVVSNGDLLDMRSSNVTAAYIQGRKIDLTDKHKLLNDRFEQKYEIKPKKGF
jgi:adenine deaminase